MVMFPFFCLYPNKSIFSITRVFGCTCFVQDLSPDLDKLSSRSIKYVFIGYSKTQKEYRCYSPSNKKHFVSADVTFFESIPYFSPQDPVIASELSLFHHLFYCLHLLLFLMSLHQCIRGHYRATCIKASSDTSTLIDKKIMPLNQF